ncbi:hypothetical protein [Streptomyces sp. NRRL S-813]|nr:hypothetical protein [Streptomyces sp. NRRL S-813]
MNHTLTKCHSLRLDENAEPHVVFCPPTETGLDDDHDHAHDH